MIASLGGMSNSFLAALILATHVRHIYLIIIRGARIPAMLASLEVLTWDGGPI